MFRSDVSDVASAIYDASGKLTLTNDPGYFKLKTD